MSDVVGKDFEIDPNDFDSWLDFWTYMLPRESCAPSLARVAIKILSAIVQSASCERLFSQFLLFHTKIRNRLGSKKVMFSTLGKRAVHEKDVKEEVAELKAIGKSLESHMGQCIKLVDHKERPKKGVITSTHVRIDVPCVEVLQCPV